MKPTLTKGVIKQVLAVTCNACDQPFLISSFVALSSAEKKLRANGWSSKGGAWYCPNCKYIRKD